MEQNKVKEICKELGITQKELADIIGVNKDTVGNWSRGAIDTPKIAIKTFELLIIERKFNTLKEIFLDKL